MMASRLQVGVAVFVASIAAGVACAEEDHRDPDSDQGGAGGSTGGSGEDGGAPQGGSSNGGSSNGGSSGEGGSDGGASGQNGAGMAGEVSGGGGDDAMGGSVATGGTGATGAMGGTGGSAGGASGAGATAGTGGASTCGNGRVDGGESCDDGNRVAADGCDPNCSTEPGWSCAGMRSVCSRSCMAESGTECQGESCCTSLPVTGGGFLRGRSTEVCTACVTGCPAEGSPCDDDELPEHPARVGDFYFDKYEATAGRLARFATAYGTWHGAGHPTAGEGAHPRIAGSGWQSAWDTFLPATSVAFQTSLASCSDATAGRNGALPSNCLSWYEAFAFCIWDGGRLPTEAEFEYAATGGEENRVYPWGAAVPDATRAVYNGATLVVVGSKPAGAGRYGQLDLAGSLWEWVLDLYAPYGTSCDDCANLTTGTTRVLRGPSFSNTDLAAVTGLRAANRYQDGRDPALHLNTTGVRCARH